MSIGRAELVEARPPQRFFQPLQLRYRRPVRLPSQKGVGGRRRIADHVAAGVCMSLE